MTAQHAVLAIARCTVLEAWRGRLPWVMAALAATAFGMAGFAQQLALAEGDATGLAVLGALLRAASACGVIAFAVMSVLGEAQGRGVHLVMAMALPRGAYVAGKFAGLALLAVLMAGGCGLAVAAAAAPGALPAGLLTLGQLALWTLSLMLELWLAAAIGLLCALALAHPLPALAAALGFYLLARIAPDLQLAAQHSLQPDNGLRRTLALGFDVIAALMPRLDLYTRASWLIYGGGDWAALAAIAGQTALYLLLLGAAAMHDLRRREL